MSILEVEPCKTEFIEFFMFEISTEASPNESKLAVEPLSIESTLYSSVEISDSNSVSDPVRPLI